jgi:Rad3-related DNA helicase
VSLEEDKCRLIIIAKAPYLSLGDRIISTRLYSSKGIGNDWYKATMMLTLLQMAGRGVRSRTDYAETFILDDQARKAILERPKFLPEWFLDALISELPIDIRGKAPFLNTINSTAKENIETYYRVKQEPMPDFDDDVPF